MRTTRKGGWRSGAACLLAGALALVASACVADLSATGGGTGNACNVASDCGGDALTCSVGYCVAEGTNSLTLRARIVVPPSSTLVSQQIPALDLSQGDAITVALVEPVMLWGVVANKGDTFVSNLAGEIEARASGDLPWLDHRFTARSFDGLDQDGHGYELAVLPGRDYEVIFRPDDKTIPPHAFTLTADEAVDGKHDILLPAKDEYVQLGVHVRLGEDQPIPGARLTVLMPDGRGLPTVTIDTVQSVASLKLPPGTAEVRVRVEAPADGPVFPEFVSEPFAPTDGVKISVPPLPPSMAEFDAEIRVLTSAETTDGEREPVQGVTLALLGHLEGGTLRRSASTDSEGVARFRALPGAYDVHVIVPNGKAWGSTVAKLNLTPPPREGGAPSEAPSSDDEEDSEAPMPTIVLPDRPRISGTVIDASGTPVHEGVVVARRRVQPDADGGLVIAPSPVELSLTENGTFSAPVDAGTWDIAIRPAAHTGAPTDAISGIALSADEAFEFRLRDPGLAFLTLVDGDGNPQADVTVELFLADQDDDPLVLAKGTTGEDGSVALLIPHVVAD